MRTALFGAALAALIVVLPGAVRAAPYQNDDDGLYTDDFSDNTGIASGAANAVFQPLGGWVELGTPGLPGVFTTKPIDPLALTGWGKVYVKGSGALSVEVLSGGNPIASPTLVASDDARYTRMASLAAIGSTKPIQLRVTFSANGPVAPYVDALALTWTPASTLRLAANAPTSLCSGATGLWKFPFSASNVTARKAVVTVALPTGTLSPSFGQQNRLAFVSATHGGQYNAGPGAIVVDGVTVAANTVYWRLGDVRFGTTFPLGLTASIPNGTLDATAYVLQAEAFADNAPTVSASTGTTLATAQPALTVQKSLINAYRIGDQWRANAGTTIGYRLTVRNEFAPTCRATAQRVVVWDPLQIATTPGGAYPYAGAPSFLSAGLAFSAGGTTLHNADAAGNAITIPANAVYAQIPELAPGASATFEVRLPLAAGLAFDEHVVNTALANSGYVAQAGQKTASADFYIGIDYTPHGDYAKGDAIRGASAVTAAQDNTNLQVGYGEYFKFLLSATNAGASVLRDTTLFDKLPTAEVDLVDVFVPASSGATIYYYAASSPNANNVATNPPGYDATTGALTGWTTTRPADPAWVAVKIPRIGSTAIPDNNAGAPLRVTAEIGVRAKLPTADCVVDSVDNVGWFHTVSYEDGGGVVHPTNAAGTANSESVTIVPQVPSFELSYATATPSILTASGPLHYDVVLVNRRASAPDQTDDAEDVVVRILLPHAFIAGAFDALDFIGASAPNASIDYSGLPTSIDVHFDTIEAGASVTIGIDMYAPRGMVDGATATLSANIMAHDVGDICPVLDSAAGRSVSFSASPFLQIDKRLDFAVAGPGDEVTYTLRMVNVGEAASRDTVVFDQLPDVLELLRIPVPTGGQTIWFSDADPADLPSDVNDPAGNFTKSFILSSGHFAAGIVANGFVTAPMAHPRWIAILADDTGLLPPQLPANGVPLELDLIMRVPANADPAAEIVVANQANISAAGLLPAVSNRPLLLISEDPALSIDGQCRDAVAAGENVHLTHTFTNNSTNPDSTVVVRLSVPTAQVNPVALHIDSPEGPDTVSLAGDAGHFITVVEEAGQLVITWNVTNDLGGSLGSDESVTIDLELEVGTLATGTQIPVFASGTATRDLAGTSTVNVGTQCTMLVSNPDLAVAKLVDQSSAVAGDALTYTLIVQNNGPHDATNAVVRELLPAGLSIVPGSVRVTPSTWSFPVGHAEPFPTGEVDPHNGGTVLEWSLAHDNALVGPGGVAGLVPGLSDRIYISFRATVVSAAAGSTIQNCARAVLGPEVGSGDQLTDETPGDNLGCATTRVPYPDPKIVKTGPATALPGQAFSYRLAWSNPSRQPAEDVVFFEQVPNLDAPSDGDPDLTVTGVIAPSSVTVYYSDAANASTDPTAHPAFDWADPTTGEWSATLAELSGPPTWIAFKVGHMAGNAPSQSATVNVVAADPDTQADLAGGTVIENCAAIELAGGGSEESTTNNVSCATTRLPGLNVSVQKVCDPDGFFPGARPGDAGQFSVTVSNRGTSAAYGVRVVDPMPGWFTFGGFSPAVADLVDASGAPASFVDPAGNAIAGAVAWTKVGDTWYLGSAIATDPTYYRNIGMPSGARTTMQMSGSIDVAAPSEELVLNAATVVIDRRDDGEPAEATELLFDNDSECAFTVHRPDPMVVKTATIAGASVGAGAPIDYTIGYDNLGLALAEDVVLEDVFPDGTGFVIGSLIDVPAGATVSYYDGSTWGATPVGAPGEIDPAIKGLRVAFGDLAAPVAGGFAQDSAASFARGTFAGTIWDADRQAVVVDPAFSGASATYETPAVPTADGNITQWISLIVQGLGDGSALPTIELLDGDSGEVVLTWDPADSSIDLTSVDPTAHPSLKLRATFATGGAHDYQSPFVSVPGTGEGSPMKGTAYVNVGDYVAGIAKPANSNNGVAVLWHRVGTDYVRIDLGDANAQQVLYFDGQALVTQGYNSQVTAWVNAGADNWVPTVLGTAYYARAAALGGVNQGLCGPLAQCAYVAFTDNNGTVTIVHQVTDGWSVAGQYPAGATTVMEANALGDVLLGYPGYESIAILRPTGTGWEEATLDTLSGVTYWGQRKLSPDTDDALIQLNDGSYRLYRFHPDDGDPSHWVAELLGTGSSSPHGSGPDGSFIGDLSGYKFWRRSGSALPMYPQTAPAGMTGPAARALGPAGLATGSSSQSGTRPTFWEFNGSGYTPTAVTTAYWGSVTGEGSGFSSDGTLAWGSDNTDLSKEIGYVRSGAPGGYSWTPTRLTPDTAFGDAQVQGAGPLGWVGAASDDAYVTSPAIWQQADLAPGTDLSPVLLSTPTYEIGKLLAATPDGCMLGEINGAFAQWVPDGAGSYTVSLFDGGDGYASLDNPIDIPGGRIFVTVDNQSDGLTVPAELRCTPTGFQVVELPRPHIDGSADIGWFEDGLLRGDDWDYGGMLAWLPVGADQILLYSGHDVDDSSYTAPMLVADGVVASNDFNDSAFILLPEAEGGDDFTKVPLPTFGSDTWAQIEMTDGSRILGKGSAGAIIWSESEPGVWEIETYVDGLYPGFLFGHGANAGAILRNSSYVWFWVPLVGPDAGTPQPFEFQMPFDYGWSYVPLSLRAAYRDGIMQAADTSTYAQTLIVASSDGELVTYDLNTEYGFYNYLLAGKVGSNAYLGIEESAAYIHSFDPDGTLYNVAVDTGEFSPASGYYDVEALGDIAADGSFMLWMNDGGGESSSDNVMFAFYPDATAEAGYASVNLGITGTQVFDYSNDLSPGQALGNGCWTAWETVVDTDGGSFTNGIDPNGTSGLRLYGCPTGGGSDEALAAWKLAYRGDVRPSIGFQLEVADVCQQQITNTAEISGSIPELTTANNTSSATVPVATADLDVALTTPSTVVDTGSTLETEVTVTIANRGPAVATDVDVDLVLPAGLALGGQGTLHWTFATLAVGATQTYTIPLAFADDTPNVTYRLALASTAGSIDCDPGNDTATIALLSGEHPDIRVTKTGPAVVRVFEPFTWDLVWSNVGNILATGFDVTDTLPAVEIIDAGNGTYDSGAQTIVWPDESLTPGDFNNDSVTAVVGDCSLVGQTITNLVAAPYPDDADPSDNEAAWTTTILGPPAAVEVDLIAGQAVDQNPGTFHITAYYQSNGPATANGVVLTVALPFGFSLHPASVTAGGVVAGDTITWDLGALPSGASGSVTFLASAIEPGAAGAVSATVDGDDICPDDAFVAVREAVDPIAVAKTVDHDNACTGDVVGWTITVTNSGPSDVSGVVIGDAIPAGASYVAGSITGPGADDSGVPALTWNVGTIPAHSEVSLSYLTTLTASDDLVIGGAPSWGADGHAGKANATAVRVDCDQALVLDKGAVASCNGSEWSMTVLFQYTNDGPTPLTDVVLEDYVGHLPYLSSSQAPVDGMMTFPIGTLQPGASGSVAYTLTFATDPGTVGEILMDRASITSAETEPQTSNQVATVVPACLVGECDDNGDCDDSDACTTDTCEANACSHTPITCDDDDACTDDTCDSVNGCEYTELSCDDNDACTNDTCDADTGCGYTEVLCDDGDACTEDSCDPMSGCMTSDVDCDDGDPCTVDSCDQLSGCTHEALECDDGNACTSDVCMPGVGCVNDTISCDDNDACTTDTCDQATGCVYDEVVCNDGSACTTDTCDHQTGCETTPITCDDGSLCTEDSCDPATGCEFTEVSCDDQNACTEDSCDSAMGCGHTVIECDDGDACTNDTCDETIGCITDDVDCDDGDPCTVDSCDPANGCMHEALECDDNNACTNDVCVAGFGCMYDTISCDDGDACTDETCDEATGCVYDDVDCDDGSACTTDTCDHQTGCESAPITCDDGSLCTEDSCDPTLGCQFTEVVCDDFSACTEDSCDPTMGCTYTGLDCNDDDACTIDTCDDATGCVTDDVDCDDDDPCTVDTCDSDTGCSHVDLSCDDNNECTVDSCVPGVGCVNEVYTCTDGDACTTDSCNPATGCEYEPIVCDDESECTTDTCDSATGCEYEPIECDDGSACTTNACDPAIGCEFEPVSCDDFDACTTDSCDVTTGCEHVAVVCDDLNACTEETCDSALGCLYDPVVCNDFDACTNDSCDPANGCSYDTIDCSDGTECTEDSCDSALGCQHASITCDDDNACTTDVCDPIAGCTYEELSCDDADKCTNDTCDPASGCDNATVDCDDRNACTSDSCDPATGCVNAVEDCDDDDACTVDTCDPESGCRHETLSCDDDDFCTNDACDAATGCTHEPVPERPVTCGAGDCSGVVEGVETCIDNAWIDNCDELPIGEIPDTDCADVRVAYAIVNDATGAPYGTIRCFQDVDNNVIGCETEPGSETELKIYDAFFCGED